MKSLTKKISLKPSSLVWQISEKITQAILEGVFTGGAHLNETVLQNQFGVSRAPVREALRELEKKGLVEIIPRRGTFLKKVTAKDFDEVVPVRATLEGLVAREACCNLTKEDYDHLEQALQSMEQAAANGNGKLFMKHHEKFHTIYLQASKNNVLIKIMDNLLIQNKWVLFSLFFSRHLDYHKEDLKLSIKLHREILEFLKDKNEKKVEEKVKRHIEIAAARLTDIEKNNLTMKKSQISRHKSSFS